MCQFKIGTVFDNKWWHWSEILTETHNLWQPKHNYIVLNTSRISLWIQQTWSSVQKLTLQLQRAQWKLHLIIHNNWWNINKSCKPNILDVWWSMWYLQQQKKGWEIAIAKTICQSHDYIKHMRWVMGWDIPLLRGMCPQLLA